MRQTRLTNEPADHPARRDQVRLAEIELMPQRERVAELRRQLPGGATVDDYVFQEGPAGLDAGDTPARPVRLSELFTGPGRSLVICHLLSPVWTSSTSPHLDRRLQRHRRREPVETDPNSAT